jgi:hypothetical protein
VELLFHELLLAKELGDLGARPRDAEVRARLGELHHDDLEDADDPVDLPVASLTRTTSSNALAPRPRGEAWQTPRSFTSGRFATARTKRIVVSVGKGATKTTLRGMSFEESVRGADMSTAACAE